MPEEYPIGLQATWKKSRREYVGGLSCQKRAQIFYENKYASDPAALLSLVEETAEQTQRERGKYVL